jgi:subtilisin family serine protease
MPDSPASHWDRILRALRRPFRWWPPTRAAEEPRSDEQLDEEIAQFQQGLVRAALGSDAVGGIPFGPKSEGSGYLAHPGRILCRGSDLERLDAFFRERPNDYDFGEREIREVAGDLVTYLLPVRRRDGVRDSTETLREIEEVMGTDIARPDHIVYVTPQGGGKLCPATEPELPLGKGPVPALTSDREAGLGVRVSVVDTGWYADAATNPESPWLDATTHEIEGDLETVDPHDIHSYAGHGTFVAGVIRCLAPATELEIEGVLTKAGAVYESEIAAELNEALADGDRPAIISISAGTYTRKNLGLLGFDELARLHDLGAKNRGPLVVAAAGNDDTDRPFYPAAYDWVVSVGAVDEKLRVAGFSNYGRWVDVWAHGTQLVNAFPVGTYVAKEPGPTQGEVRSFTGLAQWSGTSFATPVVSGAIAAHMSRHGVSARDAFQALKAGGATFSDPKVSKGIALGPPFV